MARLRREKRAGTNVLRIVRSDSEKAAAQLLRSFPPSDEAVHEARKRAKAARAALRLVRKGLADREYRRENRALRNAARPLSRIRDDRILVDTLDEILEELPRPALSRAARLRRKLVAAHQQARRRAFRTRADVERLAGRFLAVAKRADRGSGEDGWSILGTGVERVHRRAFDALAAVRRDPSVEKLHEWRKQSKYLWHQLEILQPIEPRRLREEAKKLHRLSDLLGDDHDLAVLRERIDGERSLLGAAATTSLREAIERRRCALQNRAFVLGARIFRARPREFVSRLHASWKRWRAK